MTSLSIIGGGRWARTIAGVLSQLPDGPGGVLLHSRHNSQGIAAWIAEKGLENRLSVTSQWPDFAKVRPAGVIVASGVADHVAAASAVLDARVPVLIEKPVAIPRTAIQGLVDHASAKGVVLAASHVFLFARYFDAFAARVEAVGPPSGVAVEWVDGRADIRHGEVKSYDPRVTVFDDVLPHIAPLVQRMCGHPLHLAALEVRRGGAEISIEARAGHVPVSITMARDGAARRRTISAQTAAGSCRLDFSQEPGVIEMPDGACLDGDPLWQSGLKPLGAMLTAFLSAVRDGALDDRLAAGKALASAAFADTVRPRYAARQAGWLTEDFTTASETERAYALAELGLSPAAWHPLRPHELQAVLEGQADT